MRKKERSKEINKTKQQLQLFLCVSAWNTRYHRSTNSLKPEVNATRTLRNPSDASTVTNDSALRDHRPTADHTLQWIIYLAIYLFRELAKAVMNCRMPWSSPVSPNRDKSLPSVLFNLKNQAKDFYIYGFHVPIKKSLKNEHLSASENNLESPYSNCPK